MWKLFRKALVRYLNHTNSITVSSSPTVIPIYENEVLTAEKLTEKEKSSSSNKINYIHIIQMMPKT